jgi:hypothetical protein
MTLQLSQLESGRRMMTLLYAVVQTAIVSRLVASLWPVLNAVDGVDPGANASRGLARSAPWANEPCVA